MKSQMSQFSIIRETPGDSKSQPSFHMKQQQKPSELKFKIEPIGIQPEDDDDLETCPARTRSNWPHQINPWWKPTDRFDKPPYSYATLIAHAILTSKDGRLTLSDIYKWISETYPYYKLGQKGWQNSIRHNLSLNRKWFIKVDRRPTQAHPGKGGYWTLQMNMEKVFVDNLCQAGGHSRRHPDMTMYSVYPQTPRPASSSEAYVECPNIHITRPEDFQIKKSKSSVSAPRIRNMTYDAKSDPPQTDGKQFTIRFTPMDPLPRRKRPAPKKGKKHNRVEPGSSTREDDDDDSAVDVGSFEVSKKRKSSTSTTTPSEVIENWDTMLLTSSFEAQNILEGLTTKTIDLQTSSLKTVHFSDQFAVDDFTDPDSELFIPDCNFDQYVDFSSSLLPSDVLLEQENPVDIFWPNPFNCYLDPNIQF